MSESLHDAAMRGDEAAVVRMLASRADVDEQNNGPNGAECANGIAGDDVPFDGR